MKIGVERAPKEVIVALEKFGHPYEDYDKKLFIMYLNKIFDPGVSLSLGPRAYSPAVREIPLEQPIVEDPNLVTLRKFKTALERMHSIRDPKLRRNEVIGLSQQYFTDALDTNNTELRGTIRDVLVSSVGIHLASTYIENWKTHHEAVKRQK